MDYYNLLNVGQTATVDEIKKSYRTLVKKHHPDRGGDEVIFKQINEAYEILSDSQKRNAYDAQINFKQSNAWNLFYQNGSSFAEMFDDVYGQTAKGPDVTVRVNISLIEVYQGSVRHIETDTESFNIKIPKGITDGAKLKVKGKGRPHPVNSSAPRGDIIIIMQILPDSNLIVNGNDIWIDYTLPFYDMLLGGKFKIETPVNKVNITIPKNSYDGKILRIIGMGMPIYNENKYGNMMIKLRSSGIELTPEQLELVKKIKDLHQCTV